jgi:glycosyltransferase involved in cell wall biosynthesis
VRYLFVNQYYSPDFAATAQQMSDLCELLAAEGHDVHVLASKAVYDGRALRLPDYEVLNGVHVHRVGLVMNGRERLRHRFVGYLSFFAQAFLRATVALPKPDVVVVLTTPPLIGLLGTWLRLVRGVRFVYWVMDVYPDIALQAGVLSRWGALRACWSLLGRLTYRSAHRIVTLGHDMRRVITSKLPAQDAGKVEVIQSWPGEAHIHPIAPEENQFRRQLLGDREVCLVMYSGNMGTCHSFKPVISGIQAMAGRLDLLFAFIGGGKQAANLKECLESQRENVVFLPYQDRGALSESLSAPDVHLVTLQPRYDGLLVPSKIYGILAAGRPVLFVGSRNNEVARIIQEAGCGVIVADDDAEGFKSAVEWLARNPDEVAAMGQRGRAYFEEQLRPELLLGQFSKLLDEEATEATAWRLTPSGEAPQQ